MMFWLQVRAGVSLLTDRGFVFCRKAVKEGREVGSGPVLPACEVTRAPNSLPMLVSWVQSLVLESCCWCVNIVLTRWRP